MTASPPRRSRCPRCLRPDATCLCPAVRSVASQVQVLILMHPQEEHQAKGTARLLHLCLPASRLAVGETFAAQELARLLQEPWCDADARAPRHAMLLYPPTPPDAQHPMPTPPPMPPDWLCTPERLRLVLLDGTWRKSRKMLWNNPALQSLPRMALRDMPASRYIIRKAQREGQLSTMEATTHALQALEGWPAQAWQLQALQQSFAGLIAQHQRLRAPR